MATIHEAVQPFQEALDVIRKCTKNDEEDTGQLVILEFLAVSALRELGVGE